MPVKVKKIHVKNFDDGDFLKVKNEVIKMISFSSLPKQRGRG